MLLILEGTDCSGKTTFANSLKDIANVVKFVRPTTDFKQPDDYFRVLNEYSHSFKHLTIFDRFFYSDIVYRELRGESQVLLASDIERIEKILIKLNAIVILFEPSRLELERRYLNRGDESLTVHEVWASQVKYKNLYNKINVNKIKIKGSEQSNDVSRLIRGFMQ